MKYMKQLEPQQLKELLTEWKIVDPLLFARRFNRLLRTTEVRREYHRCALAADAARLKGVSDEREGIKTAPAPVFWTVGVEEMPAG